MRNTLLAVAAPIELQAIARGVNAADTELPYWRAAALRPGLHAVLTGVGKANAAAATALALRDGDYRVLISLGVGGSLPGSPADVGASVLGIRSVSADEGLLLPGGRFLGCEAMGFPLGPFGDAGVPADAGLVAAIRPLVDFDGVIATVSTCSGTSAAAEAIASRTGAIVEAMEGAAVGQVAARLGVPFVEVRVVSNTTGDRDSQRWDLPRALAALGRLADAIARELPAPGR